MAQDRVKGARVRAVQTLVSVIGQDRPLSEAFDPSGFDDPRERSLAREICYGTLRWYPRLKAILGILLDKPIRAKDRDIEVLLLSGLYQLGGTRVAPHAAVHETVGLCGRLGKPWARGLVNGVLRSYLRRRAEIETRLADDREARHAHPGWLLDRLESAYPDAWERVCDAANRRPPMTIRVNRSRISTREYLAKLRDAGLDADAVEGVPEALTLRRAVDVGDLPGFPEGLVSVQDASAQLAAGYLDCRPNMRVLDACAAPGGKTAHVLETAPGPVEMIALEKNPVRLRRLQETLDRLDLFANVQLADAALVEDWWDGQPFDRILLDAPCSATGIIRRQPDVKLRRSADQLPLFAQVQERLLVSLWPLLKQGGMLLYATCSVLPEENREMVQRFIDRQPDAGEMELLPPGGESPVRRLQILPGDREMDGFFYALLQRR